MSHVWLTRAASKYVLEGIEENQRYFDVPEITGAVFGPVGLKSKSRQKQVLENLVAIAGSLRRDGQPTVMLLTEMAKQYEDVLRNGGTITDPDDAKRAIAGNYVGGGRGVVIFVPSEDDLLLRASLERQTRCVTGTIRWLANSVGQSVEELDYPIEDMRQRIATHSVRKHELKYPDALRQIRASSNFRPLRSVSTDEDDSE